MTQCPHCNTPLTGEQRAAILNEALDTVIEQVKTVSQPDRDNATGNARDAAKAREEAALAYIDTKPTMHNIRWESFASGFDAGVQFAHDDHGSALGALRKAATSLLAELTVAGLEQSEGSIRAAGELDNLLAPRTAVRVQR